MRHRKGRKEAQLTLALAVDVDRHFFSELCVYPLPEGVWETGTIRVDLLVEVAM